VEQLSTRGERLALLILQLASVAVVLAVTTHRAFELDRFLIPKELVLHLGAFAAALFAFHAFRTAVVTRLELLFLAYLLLGAISAGLATNVWLGFRALAVSASALVLFRTARVLTVAGLGRRLLTTLAVAVVLAAITSLVQAYGVRLDVFAVNRSPGGTLGNRNFVAHAAAFGLPVLLLATLRARRAGGFLLGSVGVAIVTASLVLTRSRAAWLAAGAALFLFFAALLVSSVLRRDGRTWRRLMTMALLAGAGVAAALLVPNTLRWRSDNPYLESLKGVANYEEGSGRGRLIQYERSLRIAAAHPLFGVGPGNWPVEYPRQIGTHDDPSLDTSEEGMTFNPWPSSDWIAFAMERGLPALVLMALVFLALLRDGLRQLRAALDADEALLGAALLATVAAAGVAGAFDAVLLLGLPTFLIWTTLGALWHPPAGGFTRGFAVAVILLIFTLTATARSAAQLTAMQIDDLTLAITIDPANYRLHLRLARRGTRNQRCQHALAAHQLFPAAAAARAAARGCR
jgi:O-antigen ligase